MKTVKRKTIVLLLSVMLIAAALSACAGNGGASSAPETSSQEQSSEADETQRSQNDIIEEIITYYGCYEEKADDKISELFDELKDTDERQGRLWQDIMDYWKYVNHDLEVNIDRLPDGLPDDDSMCIAVLGYQLNSDGTMQAELEGRLKVALSCAEQYPNAFVLCTGGGTAKNNPNATEGGVMGEWMEAHGLEKDRLIIEDSAHTTAENAVNSYQILIDQYPQVDSIVIVSSSYHIAWGSLLFEAAIMKTAAEKEMGEIHVISNCAYQTTNGRYKEEDIIYFETGGLLQMAGDNGLAQQYYRQTFTKPELKEDP